MRALLGGASGGCMGDLQAIERWTSQRRATWHWLEEMEGIAPPSMRGSLSIHARFINFGRPASVLRAHHPVGAGAGLP
jgi:hypothetical protein